MENKLVLGYWNIRGLGQPIRLLLEYLHLDYEDKRYDCENKALWLADKENLNLDFPNLPYLLDGNSTVCESRAIMKYICRANRPELLGETQEELKRIDMVDNFIYDFGYTSLGTTAYEDTEELHTQFRQLAPVKMGYLSKFLGDREWLGGNKLTYVDFYTYENLRHYQQYDPKGLDNFQNLLKYLDRVESIPEIKKYMESPKYLAKPMFSSDCKMKVMYEK